jgi:hypothetical protein
VKRTVTIRICDACGRNFSDVDTKYESGEGSLKFHWVLGSSFANGGASGDENIDDLCCECTKKMRELLSTFKKEQKLINNPKTTERK